MNSPLISVIVPVYQVEPYIRQCLESLCAQTLRDIEIICVDDCGHDGSMSIVEEYAARDPRIRVLRHAENRGLSAARNTAMAVANAPYLMFCDSDDWMEPQMCEVLFNAIEREREVDMAICGVAVHSEQDEEQKDFECFFRHRYAGVVPMTPAVAQNCDECVWNKIYRKALIDEHNISFPDGLKNEDVYFFNSCAPHARRMCFVEDKLYHYRRRPGSIMSEIIGGGTDAVLDKIHVACRLWKALNRQKLGILWKYHADLVWKRCLDNILLSPAAERYKHRIAALLRNFIKEVGLYNSEQIPPLFLDALIQLCGKPQLQGKSYFGIAKERCSLYERKLKILGTSICNEKYDFDALSVKRWFRKEKQRVKASAFYTIPLDHEPLLAELKALGAFTYIPDPGNLGDALLAAATLQFFDAHHLPYRMLGETDEPSDTLVYGGGGIWVPNYEKDWQDFLPLFAKAKKVLILPSSFDNCPRLVEQMDERFTVFCREERSYRYLLSAGTKAKILLDHDMALRLPAAFLSSPLNKPANLYSAYEILERLAMLPATKVGYMLRVDSERTLQPYVPGLDLSNYFYFSTRVSRDELCYYAKLMLCAVELYETIVTDRLHIGIAAALMGKEVYLLDNSYKKLSGVYQHSLRGIPHVHMADELPLQLPTPTKTSPNARFAELLHRFQRLLRKRWIHGVMLTLDSLSAE